MAFAEEIHKHKTRDIIGLDAHRKWSWADEWGWVRSIHIPYSKNGWVDKGQVLAKNPGEWDGGHVQQPCVLRIGDTYRLYYTGRNGAWETTSRIGLATSTDGLNFTRYGTDGKVVDPPTGYSAVCAPSVLYDVYETDSAKKYKLLCTGYKAGAWHPLYFTSSDGISWTFQFEMTGLTTWENPTIVYRFGNAYFLFHRESGTKNIMLEVTRDFSTFYNHGVIVTKGSTGEWDDDGYGYLGVFWSLGVWYLLLQCAGPHPRKIGLVISSDGFTWNKYPMNPIQKETASGWAVYGVQQPGVIMVEDRFWLYCCGYTGSVFSIGRFDIA